MKRAIRKMGAFLAMLTIFASIFALGVSAVNGKNFTNYDTVYYEGARRQKEGTLEGSKYSVDVMYILGEKNNIFKNPSLTAIAGAMTGKYRYVYAVLTETSNKEQCEKKDSGAYESGGYTFKTIEANAWEYGQYGIGYCSAQVYSGATKDDSLAWEIYNLYATDENGGVELD